MATTDVINTLTPIRPHPCPADRSLGPLHLYISRRPNLCGVQFNSPHRARPRCNSRNETHTALCIPRRCTICNRNTAPRTEHVQQSSRHFVCAVSEVSDFSNAEQKFPLEDGLIQRVSSCHNANEALGMIEECVGAIYPRCVVSMVTCLKLIECSLSRDNATLAFAIVEAMRSAGAGAQSGQTGRGYAWPPVDVVAYAALVRGLAASLRVSDAIRAIGSVRRRGVPMGEEVGSTSAQTSHHTLTVVDTWVVSRGAQVPFGKVVDCPTCNKPLAVVQPQHGCQVAACSLCRYETELMSGCVAACESEAVQGSASLVERGVRLLQLGRVPPPAAVHTMVVRAPDGVARTHRFATSSADIPGQTGERVTIASAARRKPSTPSITNPFPASARVPGWRPSEPMALTNHDTGRVSKLLRAPLPTGSRAASETSWLLPGIFLLASSDAASALVDPSLPRVLALGAASLLAAGAAANTFLLPRLNQLSVRTTEAVAVRQDLLGQHQRVEERLHELAAAAGEEVRMLARMWQLQNKMGAVGEPATYSTRMARVSRARVGLEERLSARLSLIDSYAKIAAMIEIEVEMDSELLAAEDAGAAANIAEQMRRVEEVDSLQKEWQIQAEANNELERLLSNAPPLPESL